MIPISGMCINFNSEIAKEKKLKSLTICQRMIESLESRRYHLSTDNLYTSIDLILSE